VAILGQHLPTNLGVGIRGVALEPTDPLCNEWIVIMLGPHTASALIGREHGGNTGSADGNRGFEFAIT